MVKKKSHEVFITCHDELQYMGQTKKCIQNIGRKASREEVFMRLGIKFFLIEIRNECVSLDGCSEGQAFCWHG
jgi:hypothetical protein